MADFLKLKSFSLNSLWMLNLGLMWNLITQFWITSIFATVGNNINLVIETNFSLNLHNTEIWPSQVQCTVVRYFWQHPVWRAFNNYVRGQNFATFWPTPLGWTVFYPKPGQKQTFLDPLPPSSYPRNYWMAPLWNLISDRFDV